MEQHVRPRLRDRWRAGLFHTLAITATTAALGVIGGLAVVAVAAFGGADLDGARSDEIAVRLLGVVPVMVITATGVGLVGGACSAPWGIRPPSAWTRPTIAGLIGAFHLAGRVERARYAELAFGTDEVVLSVAVTAALWTAIAVATGLGGHRGVGPARPTGRPWREALGAAGLFTLTITYLAVRA